MPEINFLPISQGNSAVNLGDKSFSLLDSRGSSDFLAIFSQGLAKAVGSLEDKKDLSLSGKIEGNGEASYSRNWDELKKILTDNSLDPKVLLYLLSLFPQISPASLDLTKFNFGLGFSANDLKEVNIQEVLKNLSILADAGAFAKLNPALIAEKEAVETNDLLKSSDGLELKALDNDFSLNDLSLIENFSLKEGAFSKLSKESFPTFSSAFENNEKIVLGDKNNLSRINKVLFADGLDLKEIIFNQDKLAENITPGLEGLIEAPGLKSLLKMPQGAVIEKGAGILINNSSKVDYVQQIIQEIHTNIKDKVQEAYIQLKPEYLGKAFLKIKLQDGIVSIRIEVENNVVKESLQSRFGELKNSLEEKGFSVDNFSIMMNLNTHEDSHSQQLQTTRPDNSLPSFFSKSGEELSVIEPIEQRFGLTELDHFLGTNEISYLI